MLCSSVTFACIHLRPVCIQYQYRCLQDSILPPDVKARVSVEAASTFGWLRYVGFEGISLGVDQFGQSAPAPTIYEKLGITVDGAVKAVKSLL